MRFRIDRRVVAIIVATLLLASVGATFAADDWTMPRTPWGHPDLQGVFTNTTLTPFERPTALGEKAFLTEEEAAELEKDRANLIEGAAERPASETAAGGSIGAYNLHWMELGTKVVGDQRTSLVSDAATGRAPVRPDAEVKRD